MVFYSDTYETLTTLFLYMFIYNITLSVFFFTLFQFVNFELKTLFSLTNLGSTNIFTKVLIILILSMAGVPPFWGFFSKLFIFILLINSNFFFFFFFFFVILFVGLYFYIQNIRFLNSTAANNFNYITDLQLRITPIYFLFTYTALFFIIFGFFFTEDFLLIFYWLVL